MVEAVRRNGISRFIQESFALTYADRNDAWVDEQTPIDPVAYNKTVSNAERSVADFWDTLALFFGLRPSMDQMRCR